MIKLHLLQKVMQVVTNVSKWGASIKNRKEKKKEAAPNTKKNNRKRKGLKKNIFMQEVVEAQIHRQPDIQKVVSKAKVMKQWITFIREDNIIYLPSYSHRNQRQTLFNRDNVVYIDFKSSACSELEGYYNKEGHRGKAHSREPTHSSYAYLL